MDNETKRVTVQFGGILPLLLVAFIVLKLCNVITWSWIWVLAPLWGPMVLGIIAICIIAILILFGITKYRK